MAIPLSKLSALQQLLGAPAVGDANHSNLSAEDVLRPNQAPPTPDVFGSFLMHPNRDAQGNVTADTPNPMQPELDAIKKRQDEAAQAQFEETDPNIQKAKADEFAQKLALQGEGPRVTGEYGLKNEALKAKAATDVEAMKAQAAGAPKYGQQEQAMIDSAQGINALGVPLLHNMETRYPGISQDPTKFGLTDPAKYGSITDALSQKLGVGAYKFGLMTADDPIFQDTAAIQALAVRALSQGRITKPVMELIQQHLPQPGLSPGANYDRLNRLLTEILPAQLQGINTAHGGAPLTLNPDPMSQIVGTR